MTQLWTAIYAEAVQLCAAIEQLPEACECGDGEAHLAGRCACCRQGAQAGDRHGENCVAVLARLRADLAMLCQDFSQAAGPLQEAGLAASRIELRRGVFLAANDLQRIVADLGALGDAVTGFGRSCTLGEMQRVKRHTSELRVHCEELNVQLTGGR